MSELRIELPPEVRAEVARRAGEGSTTEAAWVTEAVREQLKACSELEYLASRADRGTREAFDRVLAKVPSVEPVLGDEW